MKLLIVLLFILAGCAKDGSNGDDGVNGSNGADGSNGTDGKVLSGQLYLAASKKHSPASFVDGSYTAQEEIKVGVPSNLMVVYGKAGTNNNAARITISKSGNTVVCKYNGDGYRYVFNSCDDNSGVGTLHSLSKNDTVSLRVLKGGSGCNATSATAILIIE